MPQAEGLAEWQVRQCVGSKLAMQAWHAAGLDLMQLMQAGSEVCAAAKKLPCAANISNSSSAADTRARRCSSFVVLNIALPGRLHGKRFNTYAMSRIDTFSAFIAPLCTHKFYGIMH